ncbi:MAG TPA: mechanosensitive ion channel [Spirochaetota bacterium]|nr:mechanosensitive ion channel [Spirochaetota bacterium]HPQ54630.1 mechanosensitive ion channel [Spirochaetota bacterium]
MDFLQSFETWHITYIAVVTVSVLFVLLYIRWATSRVEGERVEHIDELKNFNAVKTESPLKNPLKKARENARESVVGRFSIIRRMMGFAFFTVWLVLMVIPFLGKIPAAMVSLIVTCAAVVIGIAAKPVVENIISGVVISFSRLLRTGDTVILDDHYGTVEDISITHTVIKLWDWRRYIIPNSSMLHKEFLNLSINDRYMWVYVEFWVSYDADLGVVRDVATGIAAESRYYSDYEPPAFWTMSMNREGVKCWVAAWTKDAVNAWEMRSEIRGRLIQELQKRGIKTHSFKYEIDSSKSPLPGGVFQGSGGPCHD